MKSFIMKFAFYFITACVFWLLGASFGMYFYEKSLPTKEEFIGKLSLNDRRNIAIDYACNPGQKWNGMKKFCGQIPMDAHPNK